ncbi:hypothetical protein BDR26DRAFT_865555 [Obelidium mucronatum]|nr:hypothetical protein BDR26DRAFT_865555 [Obelidium mucronatum]
MFGLFLHFLLIQCRLAEGEQLYDSNWRISYFWEGAAVFEGMLVGAVRARIGRRLTGKENSLSDVETVTSLVIALDYMAGAYCRISGDVERCLGVGT